MIQSIYSMHAYSTKIKPKETANFISDVTIIVPKMENLLSILLNFLLSQVKLIPLKAIGRIKSRMICN